MPAHGGAAGKAGDQYEALWTVEAGLRVIGGRAEHVTYESLDPEQSRGVEFNIQTAQSGVEYWSLKRQTTQAAGWTLAALVRSDEQGRSILSDLVAHIERDGRNVAVFASILGAAKLEELRSVAATAGTLKQRLDQSATLKADYEKYILPLFAGEGERARQFLTRLQIRTADETTLRTQIESSITLLFYREDGGSVDAADVRRLLAEYMLVHMHQQIDRTMLLEHLAANGLRRKDWKLDATTTEKVDELCDEYTLPLREQLISGTLQTLPGADKLLGSGHLPVARRTLISGGAGGGKSSVSAHAIERLRTSGVPVLPIRMDVIEEGVLTPQRLGEALSLPASPVAVLAGLADGGSCVLVVDQLDAVSLASGRRADVWLLFERLLAEADVYPNLRVIVACRAFDLEHDHRMRSLKAKTSAFEVVTIGNFDAKAVDEILGDRKAHPKLRPLLAVPLHLAMFLSLKVGESEDLETRDQLFASFWMQKQRRSSQRLGRECKFAAVVDWLAGWLSDHQELSAPMAMLPDELRADADVLASEHVIVLADSRYRFFHETFFDYAFARRFAQTGGCLLHLLLSGEQHLFRRAQVRQVLSFLRSNDPLRYVNELRVVLADGRVRFHIKRVVLQLLSIMPDPTQAEWKVLLELEAAQPGWVRQVNRVVSNHTGWFDRLDAAGFLESGLSSGEPRDAERIIWLCAMPEILKHRSARVAVLLLEHRRDDDVWRQYLQYVCRTGNVFHSRELFDLFLTLIRDGTLDGTRPGFAVNDNWWSTLYSMGDEAPALAVEAIAAWLDRKLAVWDATRPIPTSDELRPEYRDGKEQRGDTEKSEATADLWQYLNKDGGDHEIITKAAGSSAAFVEHLLHRVAAIVAELARPRRDRLEIDPLWSFRSFGNGEHQVHTSIFESLAGALESLARSAPGELDQWLDPYLERPHDAIAYLVLRAWSANPEMYAERLAQYLVEDARRLKIGYASWSGENVGAGMAEGYRSLKAVEAASKTCSSEAYEALEAAIVHLKDEWEMKTPRWRGLQQLQLLAAMDERRLGDAGHAKLKELRAKFPDVMSGPPQPMEVVCVRSPIPTNAMDKMTDDQWLSAMKKYAGVERRGNREFSAGGERQLALSLESRTKEDPKRFVALTEKIPIELSPSYFDAILQGVAATAPPDGSDENALQLTDVVTLIERAHGLPDRPCGRPITLLIEKWSEYEWPMSIIEIVVWYATNDPDPTEELWRKPAWSGECYYGGNPDMAGLNSTRGSAANTVAALLFAGTKPENVIVSAVDHLAHDASIAVRSQAIRALLALLNTRPDLAIPWFIECVGADAALLKTHCVHRFLQYAGHHDYTAIQPVLIRMLASDSSKTVEAGSKLTCLLALDIEAAEQDAAQARTGSPIMRKAAATIYAANVANEHVGQQCRELLLPLFSDQTDDVRAEAATAFRHIAELESVEQARLLGAFLDASPNAAALEPVIRAVEDSPVRLPDLVCRLIESGEKQFNTDAGDIRTHGALVAGDLSKIVIRLYTQSDDEAIRTRCLNAIDAMEEANFFGLSDELGRSER